MSTNLGARPRKKVPPLQIRDATNTEPTGAVRFPLAKVVFTLSGWATVRAGEQVVHLSAGSVLTIPAGLECFGEPAGYARTVTIYSDQKFLDTQVRWVSRTHPLGHQLRAIASGRGDLQLLEIPESTMRELTPTLLRLARLSEVATREFAMMALLSWVFDVVGRCAGMAHAGGNDSTARLQSPRAEVADAVGLMRSNLARAWQVQDLASAVALSSSQLTRLFRDQLGVSPAAFLNRQRVEHMAELLLTTGASVGEAASAVGWDDISIASRAFKRHYHVSPSEFTKSMQPPWHTAE